MALAIYIKTESSDVYIYALDGTPTKDEAINHLKENLGEEYEFICDIQIDSTYDFELTYNDLNI